MTFVLTHRFSVQSLNEDPALMAEVSMGMAAGVPVASVSKGSSSSSAK